ncbi:MAG TPA: hypothetical protein PLA68_13220, partial [Panacibacter sp.]|nr:hypothetical protein [Panacibacter sp.]
MKNHIRFFLIGIFALFAFTASAQSNTNYGIWQSATYADKSVSTQMNGRLENFFWKDLEIAPNVWNWKGFDSTLTEHTKDQLPFAFMIYTKDNAPDWLFTNGVPKVDERDAFGSIISYAPYYADDDYKFYFKRMITTVRQHVETLPSAIRSKMVAVQGCYGSTGDYISYKGTVASQYVLSGAQFLDLFKEFTSYYYDEYKN